MATPYKPSPLGSRTAQPSKPATSPFDHITLGIREHHKARAAKRFEREPWLKKTPVQTRQMKLLRRSFYSIHAAFYWQIIRDIMLDDRKLSINQFFLDPMTAVAVNKPTYDMKVKKRMDFSKMQRKWKNQTYLCDAYGIVSEFNLMIDNALNYYPRGHTIHEAATKLRKIFDEECCRWPRWMSNAVETATKENLNL